MTAKKNSHDGMCAQNKRNTGTTPKVNLDKVIRLVKRVKGYGQHFNYNAVHTRNRFQKGSYNFFCSTNSTVLKAEQSISPLLCYSINFL